MKDNFCVILAGGKGRRLWPWSREEKPKQFVDFFGTGQTQLQQTFARMRKLFNLSHLYVCTNEDYTSLVREQLSSLSDENLLSEPIYRNSAPSVAWAVHRISHLNPDANVIIVPSDQMILDEAIFAQSVAEGLDFVSKHDCVIVMGVKPTRPEPGYGYIQVGDYSHWDDTYQVKSFIEKPDRQFAEMFVQSDEWYWNTGMFLANARYLKKRMYEVLPAVLRNLDAQKPDFTAAEENAYVHEHFPSYPNMSLDYGLLDQAENVYVMKCKFGWADLGTWHGIYEACSKGAGDNVIIDSDVMIDDSHGNIIKLPKDHYAVINGLDGYIVAEQGNVLLICKKEDSSARIRKYVNEVQLRKGDAFI